MSRRQRAGVTSAPLAGLLGVELIRTLTRALLVAIAAGLALVLLARAAGVWEPRQPHPCELWAATDVGLDLAGCYAAFEVEP